MNAASRRKAGLFVLLCASVLVLVQATPSHTDVEQQASLQRLFADLDRNQDGQLDSEETEQFVAASLDLQQEGWTVGAATKASREALDGPDAGATVSQAELAAHLKALLQDHRVEDWVSHGLNLPQYAAAFRQAAITALDFPFLVSDGGTSLQEDLGVTSKLHQLQILRGLKRLILGLGEVPSPPLELECVAANKSTVLLTWQPPATLGHPPFHKFVLQRQQIAREARAATVVAAGVAGLVGGTGSVSCSATGGGEERWESIGEPDDEDGSWLDFPPAKGSYMYRVAAWSAFGRSEFAISSGACAVRAVSQRQPPSSAVVDVTAASNLSAGQVEGAAAGTANGGAWSWSAASSALVVALTIFMKASQLRIGSLLFALWNRARQSCWLPGQHPKQDAGAATITAGTCAALAQQGQLAGTIGSLPRLGSNRALLAGLAGQQDPATAQQQQQLLQAEPSGLLPESSGSQLLDGGEQSGQFGGMRFEGKLWGAAGAAAHAHDGAAEQLQQAIHRGAHCAHPGCHRRFDRLRDLRRKMESHYCVLCQHVYCLQHTRISPHGPRGGCGLESQCICHACFAEITPVQQAACERVNRLPKPTAAAPAEAAAAAGNDAQCDGERRSHGHTEAAGDVPPNLATDQAVAAADTGDPVRELPGQGRSPSVARRRWKKAGAAMRALVRFKAAGSKPSTPH